MTKPGQSRRTNLLVVKDGRKVQSIEDDIFIPQRLGVECSYIPLGRQSHEDSLMTIWRAEGQLLQKNNRMMSLLQLPGQHMVKPLKFMSWVSGQSCAPYGQRRVLIG